jgi:hypothetical protein
VAGESEEIKGWSAALTQNCEAHLADILFLAPWLAMPTLTHGSRPAEAASAAAKFAEKIALLDQAPSLREIAKYELTFRPLIEAASQDVPAGRAKATC